MNESFRQQLVGVWRIEEGCMYAVSYREIVICSGPKECAAICVRDLLCCRLCRPVHLSSVVFERVLLCVPSSMQGGCIRLFTLSPDNLARSFVSSCLVRVSMQQQSPPRLTTRARALEACGVSYTINLSMYQVHSAHARAHSPKSPRVSLGGVCLCVAVVILCTFSPILYLVIGV